MITPNTPATVSQPGATPAFMTAEECRTWLAAQPLASTVQMLRGAHFLSHQLWTLWWCWAVCLAVYGLFRWRSWI